MVEGRNLYGLAFISFIAVFREALEVVLFLRAIWLESGGGEKAAMVSGLLVSIVLVVVFAYFILKFSAKLPLRKLFAGSSWVLVILAVILAGKGTHALQEAGLISVTGSWFPVNINLLGIYGTIETCLAQFFILTICALFLAYENKWLKWKQS